MLRDWRVGYHFGQPASPYFSCHPMSCLAVMTAPDFFLSMPATIAKALLAPQMHSNIAKHSVRKDVLRILTLDTISSPTSAPAEIKQAGQRVLTEVLRILLHAGAARNRSLRSREDVYPNGSVSRLDYRNRLYAEAEENEKLVKKLDRELEEAPLQLHTSMTWILAQKSSSRADSPDN